MTVSGTTTFNLTVAQIVTEARGMLGIQDAEEPLQPHELEQGIRSLNMMMKAWQADGVQTWTTSDGQFTLVQSDADYVFGSGGTFTTVPIDILDARILRGSNEIPMTRMSREDYLRLPNKATQGYPTQFYYNRQRDGGTFYVWPTSDAALGTIKFTYRRYIMDAGNGTNTVDFPPEWMEAITSGLAKRLIPYYPGANPTSIANVERMAASSYSVMVDFDAAEGESSIMITPWGFE